MDIKFIIKTKTNIYLGAPKKNLKNNISLPVYSITGNGLSGTYENIDMT